MGRKRKTQHNYQTPYADLLPPLSTAEKRALEQRFKDEGGVHDPVLLTEDDVVLDGHNRLEYDAEAPTLVIEDSGEWSGEQRKFFVDRVNRGRRNLSSDQENGIEKDRKKWALELKTQGWTQAGIADLAGVDKSRVSRWLSTSKEGATKLPPPQLTCTPQLDCRYKIPPRHRPIIVERVTKGESQVQVAADYKTTRQNIGRIVNAETKVQEKAVKRAEQIKKLGGEILGIHHGDFRQLGSIVEDDSVDLIFTDPPYDEKAVPLYGDLAAFAKRVLKPGAWCLAYTGQTFLPQVLSGMAEHLTYGWCFGIVHSGGDLRFRKFKLHNKWKPIMGFYKPPLDAWWDWFPDLASGGREKDAHEWQQAESEAAHFIEAMSPAKGVVCEPFCGGGTTCVAAKRLGRQWIAFEIEQTSAENARTRVHDS